MLQEVYRNDLGGQSFFSPLPSPSFGHLATLLWQHLLWHRNGQWEWSCPLTHCGWTSQRIHQEQLVSETSCSRQFYWWPHMPATYPCTTATNYAGTTEGNGNRKEQIVALTPSCPLCSSLQAVYKKLESLDIVSRLFTVSELILAWQWHLSLNRATPHTQLLKAALSKTISGTSDSKAWTTVKNRLHSQGESPRERVSLGVDELHWASHRGWRGRFTQACVNIKSSCPHSASQTGHFLHEVRGLVRQQGEGGLDTSTPETLISCPGRASRCAHSQCFSCAPVSLYRFFSPLKTPNWTHQRAVRLDE